MTEAWESTRETDGFPHSLINGYLAETENPDWSKQKWWQSHVSNVCESRWKLTVPLRLRKVKDLNAAQNVVDFTTLVLTDEGTSVFSSHAWQLCLRSRLGLQLGEPIESGAIPRLCPGCQVPMDTMGDHALCCPKLGTYARNNDLRNQFATLCTESGLRVEKEVSPPGTSSRPADVLLHGLDSSSPLLVDFSVVHPR